MAQTTLHPLSKTEERGRALIHPASGEVQEVVEFYQRFLDVARTYPISIELGEELMPLATPEPAGPLLEKITTLRRQIASELGAVLPGMRISWGASLQPREYAVYVHGVRSTGGEVYADRLLALEPEEATEEISGERSSDPIYGAPALWIALKDKDKAEKAGYSLYDPASVIIIHLAEVVRYHARELIGRQEIRYILGYLSRSHPDLVSEFHGDRAMLTAGELKIVLQNLLSEGVPIRNMVSILEALADAARHSRDIPFLTDSARFVLSREICQRATDAQGLIHALVLDKEVEQALLQAVDSRGNAVAPLDGKIGMRILTGLAQSLSRVSASGKRPHVVCAPQLRFMLRRITENMFPNIPVISYNEIMSIRAPRPVVSILETVRLAPEEADK